jgi:hypothetical protein
MCGADVSGGVVLELNVRSRCFRLVCFGAECAKHMFRADPLLELNVRSRCFGWGCFRAECAKQMFQAGLF